MMHGSEFTVTVRFGLGMGNGGAGETCSCVPLRMDSTMDETSAEVGRGSDEPLLVLVLD
jgi:hypothetical protein